MDSQIPNKVVEEALKNKKIKKLVKYTNILREKTFGKSKFDFIIKDGIYKKVKKKWDLACDFLLKRVQ